MCPPGRPDSARVELHGCTWYTTCGTAVVEQSWTGTTSSGLTDRRPLDAMALTCSATTVDEGGGPWNRCGWSKVPRLDWYLGQQRSLSAAQLTWGSRA